MVPAWTQKLPINVYVIEHAQGLVLFDAGQDRRSVTDSSYFPGDLIGFLYQRLATFDIAAEETLPELLRAAGNDSTDVTHLAISHLHQDHIGGLGDLPNAEVLVSKEEWRQVHRFGSVANGYLKEHISLPGIRWTFIDFASATGGPVGEFSTSYDIFGDETLRLIPTPGHTPGSMPLLVPGEGRAPALLVGDLTYDAHHFDADHIPGVGDPSVLRDTTERARRLASTHEGLVIAAAHDPAAPVAFESAMTPTEGT